MKESYSTRILLIKGSLLWQLLLLAGLPAFGQSKMVYKKSLALTSIYKDLTYHLRPGIGIDEVAYYSVSAPLSTSPAVKEMAEEENSGDLRVTKTRSLAPHEQIVMRSTAFEYPRNANADIGITYYPPAQLQLYAMKLKQYAKKNGYDTAYAFFCNMGMLSNKKRFFVMNLSTLRIEQTGLVSHGRGKQSPFYKQYSNEPGSNCTALGRYKISGRYSGEHGLSYKMTGLDSTNKKASSRRIVLHSMPCIPDTDAQMPACNSEGCPAVSPVFLGALQKIIDTRKKPVLLWIFDSNLEDMVIEEKTESK